MKRDNLKYDMCTCLASPYPRSLIVGTSEIPQFPRWPTGGSEECVVERGGGGCPASLIND